MAKTYKSSPKKLFVGLFSRCESQLHTQNPHSIKKCAFLHEYKSIRYLLWWLLSMKWPNHSVGTSSPDEISIIALQKEAINSCQEGFSHFLHLHFSFQWQSFFAQWILLLDLKRRNLSIKIRPYSNFYTRLPTFLNWFEHLIC